MPVTHTTHFKHRKRTGQTQIKSLISIIKIIENVLTQMTSALFPLARQLYPVILQTYRLNTSWTVMAQHTLGIVLVNKIHIVPKNTEHFTQQFTSAQDKMNIERCSCNCVKNDISHLLLTLPQSNKLEATAVRNQLTGT